MTNHAPSVRRRRSSSIDVRDRILDAAATEFAAVGFEGASTRTIATRAGVHQAQIGYHIGTKDELWRASVDVLFARLRDHLERAVPGRHDDPVADPAAVFSEVVRRHVRHTANHPQLSRIMLMESARETDRVEYLLRQHVRPVLAMLQLVWDEVRAAGAGRDVPAEDVFMVMIGLAPIPFAQAGIMRPLLGAARCKPDRHAESIIDWILG